MKLGIRFGSFINNYIKSYGSTFFIIRRYIVKFICSIIAQIDEKEYKKCRGTVSYKLKKTDRGKTNGTKAKKKR